MTTSLRFIPTVRPQLVQPGRRRMFAETHTEWAPWHIVDANDQKRARLNCIAHLLETVPWQNIPWEAPDMPERQKRNGYRPDRSMVGAVPERW